MSVIVRPMTETDVPRFLELVQALADYEKLPGPDAGAQRRLSEDAIGNEPRFRVLLAEAEGRVVGYAVYLLTYSTFLALPTLYVEDIFVLPEHRRNGAGRTMMSQLGREAVRLGCGRMEWHVLDWNTSAQEFYQSLGARIQDDWRLVRLTGDALERFGAY